MGGVFHALSRGNGGTTLEISRLWLADTDHACQGEKLRGGLSVVRRGMATRGKS